MTSSSQNRVHVFGDFVLDPSARSLTRLGEVIPLTPKEFDTLVFLVEEDGKAIEKNELVRAVWKETFVGDNSLARNISTLRRYLGAESIQTLPKFGYRFALPVTRPSPLAPASIPKEAGFSLGPGQNGLASQDLLTRSGVRTNVFARVVIAALIPLIVLGGAAVFAPHQPRRATGTPRIAVLPFRNRSASPRQSNYLRDGFAEEVTNRLSQLSFDRLRVLARGSSEQYLDTAEPPKQVAEELGAEYLLDGTLAAEGRQLHLKVELIDGPDQTILWSRDFDGEVQDLPKFEDQVVAAVASSANAAPQPGTTLGALPGETASAEAHEAYLRGRYLLGQRNLASERQALEQFQRAVALDPRYARGYEGIAEAYIFMGGSILPEHPFAKAKEAALTAIRIDSNLAEAHRDLAYAIFTDEADIKGAEAEYRRAIELNPDDARAHHWYAQLLASARQHSASVREATVGYQLDPRSVGSIYNYGFMLIQAGQTAEGVHLMQELLKHEPENDIAWGYLGTGYARMHDYSKSANAFLHASKFSAVKVEYRAAYAYALAMNGEKDKAREIVRDLEQHYSSGTWVPGQSMMAAYIGLGDRDKQLLWLRRGVEDHSIGPFEANTDPIYSACMKEPACFKVAGRLLQ